MSRLQSARQLQTLIRQSRQSRFRSQCPAQSCRAFGSTSTCRSKVSETIDGMVEKFKKSVKHTHSEQYEGVAERGLRMLVFGKPGSGKGTLSARLVQDYNISFVSTGDVLRKEIARQSEVGKKAEEVVASGGLVSDELMLEVVKAELDRLRGKSWIIDGFPRTLHQGELLDAVLNSENRPLNMIVHLNVPDSVIMARIAARWVHLPSGRVYNTTYSAPKVPGIDDITGEPLSKRPDDTPETFTKRLSAYYESTAPLLQTNNSVATYPHRKPVFRSPAYLQYFSQIYPDALHSISGSSSDEVENSSPAGKKSNIDARASAIITNPNSNSNSTPTPTSTPTSFICSTNTNTNANSAQSETDTQPQRIYPAIEKLWPQLQALIEPFGLHRKAGAELDSHDSQVEEVRKGADDLRDAVEEAEKEAREHRKAGHH